MQKSWIYHTCIALAMACISPFAAAYEYVKPAVWYVAEMASTGYGESAAKFDAELVANCQCRTVEAARANGLLKESNGYRIATMLKGIGAEEVGWRDATPQTS